MAEGKRLRVLAFGDPVLRQVAAPVRVFHKKLQRDIDSLAATLAARNDGAALAAPQVGLLKRFVVMDYQNEYLELVNPRILEAEGQEDGEEGCLSFVGFFGVVPRASRIRVAYQDRFGAEHVIEREGLVARCLQHEIDHLDGILFPDRMKESSLIHPDSGSRVRRDQVLDRTGPPPATTEQPPADPFA